MFVSLQSFGQLNPVNNLEWDHWYICPNNFFSLTWNPPDSTPDTLIGYKVYRNNEFYRFQTETILNHEEEGGNCEEEFVYFHGGLDFWIHVTAIYNSSLEESNYIDSAYCEGFMIGIEESSHSKQYLFPNPTTGKINIEFQNVKMIYIADQIGKIIEKTNNSSVIDLSNNPRGIYFIKVITDRESFVEKVVLY